MDAAREKQELQAMLVSCRILVREFPEGVTAKNLNVLMNLSKKFAHSINNVQNVDAHLVTPATP